MTTRGLLATVTTPGTLFLSLETLEGEEEDREETLATQPLELFLQTQSHLTSLTKLLTEVVGY